MSPAELKKPRCVDSLRTLAIVGLKWKVWEVSETFERYGRGKRGPIRRCEILLSRPKDSRYGLGDFMEIKFSCTGGIEFAEKGR